MSSARAFTKLSRSTALTLLATGALLASAAALLPSCRNEDASKAAARAKVSAPAKPAATAADLALEPVRGRAAVDFEITKLEGVARAEPRKLEVWVRLGQAWIRKARETSDPGFYLNADACVDRALEIAPDDVLAKNVRGMVFLNAHRFDEARDIARSILDKDGDNPMARGTLSDALLELGEVDGATEAVQRMVAAKPNLASYSRLSYLMWLHGDVENAIDTVRLAIDAGGAARDAEPLAWVLVQAATYFWHRGDYEGADAGFRQALQVVKDYPPALVGRGRCAMAAGTPERAAPFFKQALDRSPLTETAWLLSDARAAMNDPAGAEAAALSAEKEGRADRRTLSLMYSVKNRNPARALELAETESKKRGDVYTLDALAWARFRSGKLAEATAAIDRARRLGTKDARLMYHRGAIYIANGRVQEGEKLVADALELNPAFDATESKEAAALVENRGNRRNLAALRH
jgi:tetratricopeptide (TPR) repeat protein